MLLYLPFLMVARIVIAFNLKTQSEKKDAPISYQAHLLIVVGVALTVVPLTGIAKVMLLLIGDVLLGHVATILMPSRTFVGETPRRAALAGMFFLAGSYFSANELVSLTAHDIYHANA